MCKAWPAGFSRRDSLVNAPTLFFSFPLQFFQQDQGQDNRNDMINFAMIAVALYVVYKGFSLVVQL